MIAALFVATGGIYFGRPDVEPYDIKRDAMTYRGPHPVVAHPPCDVWGRYWFGGPSAKVRRKKGDDGGKFKHALEMARECGGVIEHPEASGAWKFFGLNTPPRHGGWVNADFAGGWTCCVEQGHYGHRARKATWLLVYGVTLSELPELVWGPSKGERLDEGFHSTTERRAARAAGIPPRPRLSAVENRATPPRIRKRPSRSGSEVPIELMGHEERMRTPEPFAELLLSIAKRSA